MTQATARTRDRSGGCRRFRCVPRAQRRQQIRISLSAKRLAAATFLADHLGRISHQQATSAARATACEEAHVCSCPFRPSANVLYEHVFCSQATSTLAQHAVKALALTRAFLLLEDDDPVDWEVDREDRGIGSEPPWAHEHRRPLRGRRAVRRAGQAPARPQVCICPIESASSRRRADERHFEDAPACPAPQRGSRITTGSSRVAIDL